jgi:hypothetical protein
VQLSLYDASAPLGQLLAGVAVETFGVQPVLAAIAVGLVGVAVLVLVVPTLRGLDRPATDVSTTRGLDTDAISPRTSSAAATRST